jgi:hypothetical protein
MQWVLPILIVVHVVPGIFWAGSTFVLARLDGTGAEQLGYPQMGAATTTVLAGGILWGFTHGGAFGTFEQVLALGAVCAIAAAGIQSAIGLPAIRRLAAASEAERKAHRTRIAFSQRAAAGLLVITIICMLVARYI